ncbi:hypothetical protein SmJEL517_g05750 [Synchytrium microbalum]|uniref:HAMP domain-containing protein n=1 Tax=Synchytrium microbalum TaxID=1806994 RepID=A0A507BZK5_9FUNG|nr:uncharacterized protein SmJEL517_g05750 [Synchytrium microbalum]TPX30765.1 hypothetical protein SmJEL517_g05750 [Synchytrium microbalum]
MTKEVKPERRFTIPIWALLLSETILVAGTLCLIIGLLFSNATTTSLNTFGTSLRNALINNTMGNVTASLVQMEDALFTITENPLMMTFASLDPAVATSGISSVNVSGNTAALSLLPLAGAACKHLPACEGAGFGLGDNLMMAYSQTGKAWTVQDATTGAGPTQTNAVYTDAVNPATYQAVLTPANFLLTVAFTSNTSVSIGSTGWKPATVLTPQWSADARSVVPIAGTSNFLLYMSYFRMFYQGLPIDTGNPAQHFTACAWIAFSISALENALSEFAVTPNGLIYIVTTSGLMVSSSVKNVSQINYGPTSYNAANSPNTYIKESNLYLNSQYGSLSNIPATGLSLSFSSTTGEALLCDVQWLNRTNLNWIVITVIPRSDIWGLVDANSRNIVISTTIVGVLGGLISAAMALVLTRPIRLLQTQMVKAREFDFSGLKSGYLDSRSIFTEINSMQTTFVQMLQKFANGIKQNKDLYTATVRQSMIRSSGGGQADATGASGGAGRTSLDIGSKISEEE